MDDTEKRSILESLTERELEILPLIEEGLTNREIAQRLVLSLETVKWYNKQLFSKLGVHNRTQAVASAKAMGLMDQPSDKAKSPEIPPQHNLPAQVSSFIGRRREISEIKELLSNTRLLTLSGPPGTGKSRLALQVASQLLNQFDSGVYFVDLAPIINPQFVSSTIAQAFEVGESGSQSLFQNITNFLRNKHLLLVLDNFEHLIEAASLVGELLSIAPGLKILVTSRQVLQVYGEQEYLVPPLTIPDLERVKGSDALSQYEAVELFYQRAQAVKPDFDLSENNASTIAEICIRLDGLPLAIELAAARSKLLSPEMIQARLKSRLETLTSGARDLPTRLQTLRGTIDWSYELLEDEEKVLFTRLSVFQGGRTIEAAEAVCSQGLSLNVIDGLESLLNKSLLNLEQGLSVEPRFFMLETIHEYAREKLAARGEEKNIQQLHAAYFAQLAEQAEQGLSGPDQTLWFDRLWSEHDNLRRAIAFSVGSGKPNLGLQIAGALRIFWYYSGHAREGLEWIERLLDISDAAPSYLCAKALNAAGMLSYIQGDYERGKRFNTKALSLSRELGDKDNIAWALFLLGVQCSGSEDEIEEGSLLIEESLAMFRAQEDTLGIIWALNSLGEFARINGDYERAEKAYEECLPLCLEIGDKQREAFAIGNLSVVAVRQGDYELAEARIRKALTFLIDHRSKYPLAIGLAFLAGPIGAHGDPKRAGQLLGASAALLDAMGLGPERSDKAEIEHITEIVRKQLDEESFNSAWTKGQAMSLEQAVAFALEEENES
jgi:predicted ATPase/DNA-binding CsgD family transcriptional regulator